MIEKFFKKDSQPTSSSEEQLEAQRESVRHKLAEAERSIQNIVKLFWQSGHMLDQEDLDEIGQIAMDLHIKTGTQEGLTKKIISQAFEEWNIKNAKKQTE
ncbi:MAG: hypothetical protein WD991_02095 [Candidatus Paceibacterota bacterium]